jgi:AraC-like DNA-binding protein
VSYSTRSPSGRLQGVVERFWRVDEPAATDAIRTPETICPDGCTEIILHLGDPMLQAVNGRLLPQGRYLLVTQMDGPVTIVPTGSVAMVGARLRAGAMHRLLPTAQDRLAGQILDLDAIWQEWTRRTAEQVSAAAPDGVLNVFERAVEALFSTDSSSDLEHALDASVSFLHASGGRAPIERLASHAGLSRRQFERRFSEHVGLSPRLFGRIIRFQRAFRLLGTESGAAIAARCGFADQAHLVREVHRFAGVTPTLLAEAEGMTAFFRG